MNRLKLEQEIKKEGLKRGIKITRCMIFNREDRLDFHPEIENNYAENSDLPEEFEAESIYDKCSEYEDADGEKIEDKFTDISDDVCRVIERELGGKFEGDGWRRFKYNGEEE